MNAIFQFLHGKRYTLDGVAGVFKHSVRQYRYPYEHTEDRLDHESTAAGRRSAAYLTERAKLGDDWSTDLTDSIETYCRIAQEFGYKEQ